MSTKYTKVSTSKTNRNHILVSLYGIMSKTTTTYLEDSFIHRTFKKADYMSIVQFIWKDKEWNTRIVGQFETDWVFEEGKTFEFWGGTNEVRHVDVCMKCSDGNKLEVIQVVTILPHWYNESLHLTPEEVWKDSQIIE